VLPADLNRCHSTSFEICSSKPPSNRLLRQGEGDLKKRRDRTTKSEVKEVAQGHVGSPQEITERTAMKDV
jgi:hypothetical protein